MLPAVRREFIKRLILERKNVSVVEVSALLNISAETVRRDLRQLEKDGILSRTHGGAIIANLVGSSVPNEDLERVLVSAKATIAQQAVRLIRPHACVYVDSSTTSLELSRHIGGSPLTVVSNSLAILHHLSAKSELNLVGVGGTLAKTRRCFVGRSAKEMLDNYHFDVVFMSARSVDLLRGVTDTSDEEIEIKVTVAKRTNRLVLLADHTKFNEASFSRICDVADLDDLITDECPSEDWIAYAREHSVSVSWPGTPTPDRS